MAMASSRNETASFSSSFASSSSSNFTLTTRSSSPLFTYRSPPSPPSPTSSLRFSADNGTRSITVTKKHRNNNSNASVTSSSSSSSSQKRSCMCSPTTHPGSFRCAYHKRIMEQQQSKTASSSSPLRKSSNSTSSRLNLIRTAMKNSLVKIGGVESEILRRPLTTVISSSSHQLRRRETFQPRLTRLSIMSKAQDS
ncbi:hypothetical protein TanjilG_04349 [Lupinus angustifolius]|uniref:Serine-rich protein-like protein n=1 Tax=Lupinus angustifolius TaxID=3871 RepID=A0A4P1RQB9_LUPAN|nr:PREDICTED: protein MTL1-like [Lupinus angustifolius]OIW15814.1 hypothetical protein TanjilG_04349 [Lupinus angustifolius]